MRFVLFGLLALFLTSLAQAGSREEFVKNVLPEKYDQLIDHLTPHGSMPVQWQSRTGENRTLTVTLTKNQTLIIDTNMPSAKSGPVNVRMVDKNLDSDLDLAEYSISSQTPKRDTNPTDSRIIRLWQMSLAIVIKYSPCCP